MAGRPPIPRLMLVTPPALERMPLLDLVTGAAAGGVDAVYLRGLDARDADQTLIEAVRRAVGPGVALLVHGDAAGSDCEIGRHLRERDPIPAARADRCPSAPLLGRSVHAPASAAASPGVDYLLAGHVFPSASKPGRPPLGLARFAAIVAAAPCPVLAIGGITPERVGHVVRAGSHGVAVIGAIADADNPRASARELRAALDRALLDSMEANRMSEAVSRAVTASGIELVVNGKTVTLPPDTTVHAFLAARGMTDNMAVVERNGEIVPRAAYAATTLAAGDRLEVVHAVGGG